MGTELDSNNESEESQKVQGSKGYDYINNQNTAVQAYQCKNKENNSFEEFRKIFITCLTSSQTTTSIYAD